MGWCVSKSWHIFILLWYSRTLQPSLYNHTLDCTGDMHAKLMWPVGMYDMSSILSFNINSRTSDWQDSLLLLHNLLHALTVAQMIHFGVASAGRSILQHHSRWCLQQRPKKCKVRSELVAGTNTCLTITFHPPGTVPTIGPVHWHNRHLWCSIGLRNVGWHHSLHSYNRADLLSTLVSGS